MEQLGRYCEFEYDEVARKYTVVKVLDNPRTQTRDKIHKGIYQDLIPLLLNEFIIEAEPDGTYWSTFSDLMHQIGIINVNYNLFKFNADEAHDVLGLDYVVVNEFFSKADAKIENYLLRGVKYLVDTGCISYQERYMIAKKDRVVRENSRFTVQTFYRRATDDEIALYHDLDCKICNTLDISSNKEKWYGKKSRSYMGLMTQELDDKNIKFFRKGLEVVILDKQFIGKLMRTYSDVELVTRRENVANFLINNTVKNARKRVEKNPDLEDDYVDQFQYISEWVFPPTANSMYNVFPKAKKKSSQITKAIEVEDGRVMKWS